MHHALTITDAALESAISLSDAAAHEDRKQPDKSIDLLDEACALQRLRDPRPLTAEVTGLAAERARLLQLERHRMEAVLRLDDARGNLLERFSYGTYRALEAMGLGLERLVTGQVTPRPPLARPDSVRRMEEADPVARLAEAHRDRLLAEDRLREALRAAGRVIDAPEVAAAAGL
jgi:ATP-dependent Clp protease ATP-binding subunit ClpA